MWNLGNREIIVLVSVISCWALLINIFGPYLAFTIIFFIVLCGWFTHYVACDDEEDTPFKSHILISFDYLKKAALETIIFFTSVYRRIGTNIATFASTFTNYFQKRIIVKMSQRRRSNYQLSSDNRGNLKNSASTRFSLVDGLSPIPRGNFRHIGNSTNVENSPYVASETRILERASSMGQLTSTPLLSWKKDDARNGDVFSKDYGGVARNTWKMTQSFTQNTTLPRNEDIAYSAESSPWGTSISPKMRSRAGGVKTVQTVAGPLLASTRYNIDPKLYSDITSPGLTSRLTRYATEANTKLTHQSQYGTGQFPRVNLNSSPTPLINAKTGKIRMPVTVRVAPPENTRYSPPERQQILTDICQYENNTAKPSVVQVLREISLKRHASREDVTFELAKKQRTDGVFTDGLENLEEMTQKRARDDSSRSEEDSVSPPNKALRPAKRTKMPSCHDILSSLSSSISVSAGVKRKAIDVSRSGTPDIGKHFKSLDSNHPDNIITSPLSRSISEPMTKSNNKRLLNESETKNSELQRPNKKILESSPQRTIVKPSASSKEVINKACGDTRQNDREIAHHDVVTTRESLTSKTSLSTVKLTDKLFMKAEPKNIDRIKTMIEEHDSTKPRFTTDDSNEIKKSDIVMMRQTSMKTRLKSMFDAISGKGTSKINPEVVIQAEEKSTSSLLVASLNSTTSTTHVNTAPIATSAIVPIIGKSKIATIPSKHVTFQFTSTDQPKAETAIEVPKISSVTKIAGISDSEETKKLEIPTVVEKISAAHSIFTSANPTTSSTPFSINSSIFTSTTDPTISRKSSTIPGQIIEATNNKSCPANISTTTTPNASQIFNSPATASSLFGITGDTLTKSISTPVTSFPAQTSEKIPVPSFSFGAAKMPTTTSSGQSTTLKATKTPENAAGQVVSLTSSGLTAAISSSPFAFGSSTKPSSSDSLTIGSFNTPSTGTLMFGGNNSTTEKKGFTFGATTSTAPSTIFQPPGVVTTPVTSSLASTTTSSGFNFSTTNSPAAMFGTSSAPSTTTAGAGFSISTITTTPAFTFGTTPVSTITSKPGFSFVTSPSTSSTTPVSASLVPSLSFGVTSQNNVSLFGSSTTSSTPVTSQPSIFGAAPTTTNSMTAQPSIFGTPSTTASSSTGNIMQPSIFGTPSSQSSTGGFASTPISSAFGTTSVQPSAFTSTASATTSFGTPKSMETPVFGSSSLPSSSSFAATPNSSGIFSAVNNDSNSTTGLALPSFGNSGFGQKPPPAFGANAGTSSFPATTGSASSLFDNQPNETFGGSSSGPRGPPPVYGFSTTSTTPQFGTPTTAATTAATPIFGATNTSTTSFGTTTTATPVFGSISTTTPAFGTSNTSAGGSNAASSNFGATGATFGVPTTAPPPFPTSLTAASSGFGGSSAGTGFGASGNQSSAFSSNATPSFTNFGGNSASTLPFGGQTSTGTPATSFGSTNSGSTGFGGNSGNSNTNNGGNTSFTFGASPASAQQQQQPQQNTVFAFGGGGTTTVNNPVASGSSPFQFGTAAPQTGGFNFTGAPTAPAINFTKDGASGGTFNLPTAGAISFNAPPTTGGMFSIGTGSTAPRTRPSRRRQR